MTPRLTEAALAAIRARHERDHLSGHGLSWQMHLDRAALLADAEARHADDAPCVHHDEFTLYGTEPALDMGDVYPTVIAFCPWCGARLSERGSAAAGGALGGRETTD